MLITLPKSQFEHYHEIVSIHDTTYHDYNVIYTDDDDIWSRKISLIYLGINTLS